MQTIDWLSHACQRARCADVWKRTLALGTPLGAAQWLLNHGDQWIRGDLDESLVVKTCLSLALTFAVVFIGAVGPARNNIYEKNT